MTQTQIDLFISLAIVKPAVLLVFVVIFAGAVTLVRRYASPRWRKVLLFKLW